MSLYPLPEFEGMQNKNMLDYCPPDEPDRTGHFPIWWYMVLEGSWSEVSRSTLSSGFSL